MEVVKMNSLKSFKTLKKCIALLMAVVMLAGLTGAAALAEEAHEHTYEPANDYKKEPTCTEYGFTPYVCSGCGDVKYESVSGTASKATPVPGGVGTVTTSVLLKHTVWAAEQMS